MIPGLQSHLLITTLDTAWERIPLSLPAKKAIWKTENSHYSLANQNLAGLRNSFPENGEPFYEVIDKCKLLFLELDLFFVKVLLLKFASFSTF